MARRPSTSQLSYGRNNSEKPLVSGWKRVRLAFVEAASSASTSVVGKIKALHCRIEGQKVARRSCSVAPTSAQEFLRKSARRREHEISEVHESEDAAEKETNVHSGQSLVGTAIVAATEEPLSNHGKICSKPVGFKGAGMNVDGLKVTNDLVESPLGQEIFHLLEARGSTSRSEEYVVERDVERSSVQENTASVEEVNEESEGHSLEPVVIAGDVKVKGRQGQQEVVLQGLREGGGSTLLERSAREDFEAGVEALDGDRSNDEAREVSLNCHLSLGVSEDNAGDDGDCREQVVVDGAREGERPEVLGGIKTGVQSLPDPCGLGLVLQTQVDAENTTACSAHAEQVGMKNENTKRECGAGTVASPLAEHVAAEKQHEMLTNGQAGRESSDVKGHEVDLETGGIRSQRTDSEAGAETGVSSLAEQTSGTGERLVQFKKHLSVVVDETNQPARPLLLQSMSLPVQRIGDNRDGEKSSKQPKGDKKNLRRSNSLHVEEEQVAVKVLVDKLLSPRSLRSPKNSGLRSPPASISGQAQSYGRTLLFPEQNANFFKRGAAEQGWSSSEVTEGRSGGEKRRTKEGDIHKASGERAEEVSNGATKTTEGGETATERSEIREDKFVLPVDHMGTNGETEVASTASRGLQRNSMSGLFQDHGIDDAEVMGPVMREEETGSIGEVEVTNGETDMASTASRGLQRNGMSGLFQDHSSEDAEVMGPVMREEETGIIGDAEDKVLNPEVAEVTEVDVEDILSEFERELTRIQPTAMPKVAESGLFPIEEEADSKGTNQGQPDSDKAVLHSLKGSVEALSQRQEELAQELGDEHARLANIRADLESRDSDAPLVESAEIGSFVGHSQKLGSLSGSKERQHFEEARGVTVATADRSAAEGLTQGTSKGLEESRVVKILREHVSRLEAECLERKQQVRRQRAELAQLWRSAAELGRKAAGERAKAEEERQRAEKAERALVKLEASEANLLEKLRVSAQKAAGLKIALSCLDDPEVEARERELEGQVSALQGLNVELQARLAEAVATIVDLEEETTVLKNANKVLANKVDWLARSSKRLERPRESAEQLGQREAMSRASALPGQLWSAVDELQESMVAGFTDTRSEVACLRRFCDAVLAELLKSDPSRRSRIGTKEPLPPLQDRARENPHLCQNAQLFPRPVFREVQAEALPLQGPFRQPKLLFSSNGQPTIPLEGAAQNISEGCPSAANFSFWEPRENVALAKRKTAGSSSNNFSPRSSLDEWESPTSDASPAPRSPGQRLQVPRPW